MNGDDITRKSFNALMYKKSCDRANSETRRLKSNEGWVHRPYLGYPVVIRSTTDRCPSSYPMLDCQVGSDTLTAYSTSKAGSYKVLLHP